MSLIICLEGMHRWSDQKDLFWQDICVSASWINVDESWCGFWPQGSHLCTPSSADKAFLRPVVTFSAFSNRLTQSDSIAKFNSTWKRLLKSPVKEPFRLWLQGLSGSLVTRIRPQISAVFWLLHQGLLFHQKMGWTTSIWIAAYLRLLKAGLSGLCWHAVPQFCVW